MSINLVKVKHWTHKLIYNETFLLRMFTSRMFLLNTNLLTKEIYITYTNKD